MEDHFRSYNTASVECNCLHVRQYWPAPQRICYASSQGTTLAPYSLPGPFQSVLTLIYKPLHVLRPSWDIASLFLEHGNLSQLSCSELQTICFYVPRFGGGVFFAEDSPDWNSFPTVGWQSPNLLTFKVQCMPILLQCLKGLVELQAGELFGFREIFSFCFLKKRQHFMNLVNVYAPWNILERDAFIGVTINK